MITNEEKYIENNVFIKSKRFFFSKNLQITFVRVKLKNQSNEITTTHCTATLI